MNIDCPQCGRRVTLDADNRIPYHDHAPPLRAVCMASTQDATHIVANLKNASANLSDGDLAALAAERGMRLVAAPLVLDVEAARKAGALAEREACAVEIDTRAAWLEARGLPGAGFLRGVAASIRERDASMSKPMTTETAPEHHAGAAWVATPPTPAQLRQHALAHTSHRFADGRVAGLWLLRPKPLPAGWNQMSPAQRARTGVMSARKLGAYPTVIEAIESANAIGEWGVYQPDSSKLYNVADLHAYDWCPLTCGGEPMTYPTSAPCAPGTVER